MSQNTWVSSGPAEPFQYHLPLDAQAPTQLMKEITTSLLTPERRPLTASEKIEFGAGVLYGIPQGVYVSGKDLAHFAGEVAVRPIDTAYNVASAIGHLYELGRAGQWDLLKEALVPEIFELAKEWDTLTLFERGEKSSIIVSKYSADFLIPGSLVKVVGKSTKLAAELIHIEQKLAKMPIGFAGQGVAFAARGTGTALQEIKAVGRGILLPQAVEEAIQIKAAARFADQPVLLESYKAASRAEAFLEPHAKRFMLELEAKELIHQAGIPTYPRPAGIPENFLVRITEKGGGIEYVHPTNEYISVRVMPGKPHSPLPHQQVPYVVQMKDGSAIDQLGNKINKKTPEAHIPLDKYAYRKEI